MLLSLMPVKLFVAKKSENALKFCVYFKWRSFYCWIVGCYWLGHVATRNTWFQLCNQNTAEIKLNSAKKEKKLISRRDKNALNFMHLTKCFALLFSPQDFALCDIPFQKCSTSKDGFSDYLIYQMVDREFSKGSFIGRYALGGNCQLSPMFTGSVK